MAAVEKYERVLPQAEENGFSYREFSSTEGTRRKPMPGGKSMLLKLDWLMARGMECVDHGTVSTETKDCTWAEPGSALAKFTGPRAVRPQRLLGRLSICKVTTKIYCRKLHTLHTY